MSLTYLWDCDIINVDSQVLCYYYSKLETRETKSIYKKYPHANIFTKNFKKGSIIIKGNGKTKRWICSLYAGDSFEKLELCIEKLSKCKNLRSMTISYPDISESLGCTLGAGNKKNIDILNNFSISRNVKIYVVVHEKLKWDNTSLYDFTIKYYPRNGWEDFFEQHLDNIKNISSLILKDSPLIFPQINLVYEIFNLVHLKSVKVLLLGQDPYHGDNQACGVSFAVKSGTKNPPSLVNMLKEAQNEGIIIGKDSSIIKWIQEGVFLLNAALSVKKDKAGSHSKIWIKNFTVVLMKFLNEKCKNLVVVMLGGHAKKIGKYFNDTHIKIECVHPSPLSAHRGFFGSNLYMKINEALLLLKKDPVNWNI